LPFEYRIEGHQAASGGSMVPGAKSGSRIDFQWNSAKAAALAVMGAVKEESPSNYRCQAFE
jgi:hypothetical protein